MWHLQALGYLQCCGGLRLYKTSTTTVSRVRPNWFLTSWHFQWTDINQLQVLYVDWQIGTKTVNHKMRKRGETSACLSGSIQSATIMRHVEVIHKTFWHDNWSNCRKWRWSYGPTVLVLAVFIWITLDISKTFWNDAKKSTTFQYKFVL